MKRFTIFYATSNGCDSVVIDAETFADACETAEVFSRVYVAIILGIVDQSYYNFLKSCSYE